MPETCSSSYKISHLGHDLGLAYHFSTVKPLLFIGLRLGEWVAVSFARAAAAGAGNL